MMGALMITTRPFAVVSEPALSRDADSGLTEAVQSNLAAIPTYPSGEVPFPADASYTIKYQYMETRIIPSKQLLMAALGFLGQGAEHANENKIGILTGFCPSTRCVMEMWPSYTALPISYRSARAALDHLIFGIMAPLMKSEEVTFEIIGGGANKNFSLLKWLGSDTHLSNLPINEPL